MVRRVLCVVWSDIRLKHEIVQVTKVLIPLGCARRSGSRGIWDGVRRGAPSGWWVGLDFEGLLGRP